MRVPVGPITHFSLEVRDPEASAKWWTSSFDVDELFRRPDRIAIGNAQLAIVLYQSKGDPTPKGHMAFAVPNREALVAARDALRESGVALEDPGDEIGPVAEGSPNIGLWFHDLDGHRWELFVRAS
jgi:catechol 2,3-dioxygenase-like lactoylglutathione lyase family enzyme